MATSVILLERVEKLGNLGDVVSVKPGYARNYLLPQKKALRASKSNIAYFEAQKAGLEKANEANRKDAEKQAKKIEGTIISLIRQASEAGQLFGSVSARDISDAVTAETKETVERTQVVMNTNFKVLGLFPVDIALHPEVKVSVTVNIARSDDEAAIQAKTGKAVVGSDDDDAPAAKAGEQDNEAVKAEMLEENALEAEKTAAEEQAAKDAADAEKAEAKAAKKAEKAEAAAADEAAAETSEDGEAAEAE